MSCYSSLLTYFSFNRWVAAGLLALAVASCKNESEKVVPADTNYYPLAVGDYRIYNVVDTIWTRNVKSYSRFQFRERVTEQYADEAGRQNFRVIRSRRATTADSWVDDSVLVVSPAAGNVLLTQNNQRTVELIFPVRENYVWNMNAFNALSEVVKQNRRFIDVRQPFTVTVNGQIYTYPITVTTLDESIEKLYYPYTRCQVYVSGQGLVYRQLRTFTLCETGDCIPSFRNIFRGFSRTEILIENGR